MTPRKPPAAGHHLDSELEPRHRRISRVLQLTLAANLAVVVAKLLAGISAGSLAVVADAAHSSVDASNNILALVLARVAAQAPDEDHPYGHSKFETLGALAAVAFFSITIFELVTSAVRRLLEGTHRTEVTPTVINVMVASALISLLVSVYEKRQGRLLSSELLLADAAHTRADLYASVAVLGGLGLVAAGYAWADAAFTLVVAALIGLTGYRILRTTVPVLVDERAVDESTITRIAKETPGVQDCYNVRSRGREGEVFSELTISVARALDVEHAHEIADEVERRVASGVGAREVVVHVEPEAYGQAGARR
jgi:cation diffusion facilitator family transporter